METAVLVARTLAVIYLSAGIAALGGRVSWSKLIEDFQRSSGLTFFSGFITLVLGMLIVTYHNIWVKNWTVLVTIIGWMALFKGVTLILFPQFISSFKGIYKNGRLLGVFMIALGLLFGYFGFLA
ncbi:MAG: hypothetical protein PHQ54_00435 [Candidatus Omnitrophica bacterium]|nr:hypothetical protein [Candidatus Omnitrophota bacterium]